MPIAVPQTIRRAWGDEVVEAFVPWLEEVVKKQAVPRDEYREVLSRLDLLDKDVVLIKEGLTQTRAEFREGQAQMRAELRDELAQVRSEFRDELAQVRGEFRGELGQLRLEMNERFDRVNERFDRVNERFDQMHERFDGMQHQMLVQTRWLIGSLALIGTVISTLLAIGQFIK